MAKRLNGDACSAIRERSGLTKAALARSLGITRAHMGDLESGRRQPSPQLLLRIARELKVPAVAIMVEPNGDEAVA